MTTTAAPEFATLREKIAYEKQARLDRFARFEEIYQLAREAGWDAHEADIPTPMTVVSASQEWLIEDGACGFAWVIVRPGTSSFARWLVKNGHGSAAYGGGVMIWVNTQSQSLARKQAYAQAFAGVLTGSEELSGLHIFAGSRMD